FMPPAKGHRYQDPVFGSAVLRVSDALHTADSASGGNLTFVVNEYSTLSAFNEGNSHFLLSHQSYFAVYSGNGVYEHDAPFEVNASSEPRWSRQDPELL